MTANNLVSTGSYNLGLEGIAPTSPSPTAISCGDVLSGSITAQGEADLFTFNGGAGQAITITLAETTDWGGSFGANDAQVTLFSPGGVQLTVFDSDGQADVTLAAAGVHVLRVTANTLLATGSYNIGVVCP